ncbi:hypothetical protein [Methylobacterium brachiatum]
MSSTVKVQITDDTAVKEQFVDQVISMVHQSGSFIVTFGSTRVTPTNVLEADGVPHVQVTSRIVLPIPTAVHLANLIADAVRTKEPSGRAN